MNVPPLPPDEAARLQALRALNVLDTDSEERFDRYTRLAKRLFGVTTVLISLVDERRQWFKSRQGLGASETSRDISFCGHAILGELALVIPDASADERFHDNPLVTGEPRIRFYAGQPLRAPGGFRVGTLCLIDPEPRTISDDELALLADLALMVEHDLASTSLATTDELTGLSNRRGFNAAAEYALARVQRERGNATLLYFDLDEFKPINDQFGHAQGDLALRDFASVLLEAFRDSDIVARLGGDEFCVLLTGSPGPDAERAVARFKQVLEAHNRTAGKPYRLAASIGSVRYETGSSSSPEDLLRQADVLMYTAKKSAQHEAGELDSGVRQTGGSTTGC